VADPGFTNGGRGRGAADAEGVGCGKGVSLSPEGRGLGRGNAPSPEKFFDFGSPNGDFRCIWTLFLQFSYLV